MTGTIRVKQYCGGGGSRERMKWGFYHVLI
jgi:hypothetical protein